MAPRFLLPAVLALFSCLCHCPAYGSELRLKFRGPARLLKPPVFGASTSAFFESLLDDPAKIAVLKTMGLGLLRFPGGSDSNFYNWRTGLPEVRASGESSAYLCFWEWAAREIAREKPAGLFLEQYDVFSRFLGAELVIVPNLETSSKEEQAEWFRRLAGKGLVPRRIELGNEFAIAMGGDPASIARWPDARSSMRIMREYLDALRPFLPPGARIAVQAGRGSGFGPEGPLSRRLKKWDEELRPARWFNAVTLHLYPFLRDLMNDPEAGSTPPDRENARARLEAMLAWADGGTERIIADLERRLPGKEIWITEWNARGGDPAGSRPDVREGRKLTPAPLSPSMEMLATARMALVQLRHRSVTVSLYFLLGFREHDTLFVADGKGSYSPLPVAVALRWLNEAANAGGYFRRLVQADGRPVEVGRDAGSYLPVEAGLFVAPGRTILLLQNASAESFVFDPLGVVPVPPAHIEALVTPDLPDTSLQPALVQAQDPAYPIIVPPFSLVRVQWDT